MILVERYLLLNGLTKIGEHLSHQYRVRHRLVYIFFSLSFFVGPVVNLSSHGPGSCPCLPTRQLRTPALASCPPLSLSTLEAECKSKSDSNHLGDSDPDSDMANPGPQAVVVSYARAILIEVPSYP